MNVIFLFPYPLGESPSQRFRFEQYFKLLEDSGIHCYKQSFWNERTWKILYKKGYEVGKVIGFLTGILKRFQILFKLSKADYVFIHRECMPVGPPIFEWIIYKIFRKKIIYDFDDAIWLPNTSHENRVASFIKWHSKTEAICRWSYKVSCGNNYLVDFAKQFNPQPVLNPTTIDTEQHHNPIRYPKLFNEKITVGWTGSHSTLKYLGSIIPVLKQLEKKYNENFQFLVIANKKPDLDLNDFVFIPWKENSEIEDLSQIDIGIMPLTDDIWAKGKCGFKALQYMALEIPAVASPVGVNTQIIDSGVNGFLCTSQQDWFDAIDKLIQNKALRESIGIQGRKKVIEHYSVLSNSSNFVSLFS
ncbi:glycosyltransferase [Ohtaekwangia koreensis]|uniref:Glycosyltransferase involved in cell wall bisynthesis n=1 Tax=Ohtaekwangia koreensis TaxID=688867 RepID=A0A1T5LMP2_9BACT|nr:glycosyltransferase [Ohtaekwangia koreensis]SKC77194.1 Glycosyltransferase involved in cell wall bisynthesis [Ohtaekwangia koreensis]